MFTGWYVFMVKLLLFVDKMILTASMQSLFTLCSEIYDNSSFCLINYTMFVSFPGEGKGREGGREGGRERGRERE